jgi:hypothetical protein
MSIQDIQANPQVTSNFYLASIHQALTGSNLSNISLPPSPPPFTPPTYGIWINSLWFLSLVISMTCAVLANLLQQWARKYLKVTQPLSASSEPRRARYRAFYAEGVENFLLPWVFEALPAMLHLSVFLFFAGLVVFLWNFDPTISKLILSWVTGCVILYGYITFVPIFRHDSPYNTPLSPLAWSIVTGVSFLTLRVFEWVSYFLNILLFIPRFIFTLIRLFLGNLYRRYILCLSSPFSQLAWGIVTGVSFVIFRVVFTIFCIFFFYILGFILRVILFTLINLIYWCLVSPFILFLQWCFDDSDVQFIFNGFSIDCNRLAEAGDRHRKLFSQGMHKTAKKAALGLQSGLSGRAFMWTFNSSHEDEELEGFFSSLPGFRQSNDDKDFLDKLTVDQKENLWSGLVGFLDRTFSSHSLSKADKDRRATICADALDPLAFPYILDSVISEGQCAPVQSVELARFVGRLNTGKDIGAPMLTQAIVSCVVATAQLRNGDWFVITSDKLGVKEPVLRNYTPPDLSLALLIHVTCQQLHHFKDPSWPSNKFSKVLRAASKFKVQQSSPKLRHGFCSLWNQLVEKSKKDKDVTRFILGPIYKVYADIHQLSHPATGSRFFARTQARTSEVADILKNPHEYVPCANDAHHLDMTSLIPNGNDTTLITFARIAALPHSTAETTPALALVTTAPGASPAMSLATEPGAAAEDGGKSKPASLKEMDDLDTPSVNQAHTSTPDPRSSSLLSVTNSKGADAGRSSEPSVERTGGDSDPPLSHRGDDIV